MEKVEKKIQTCIKRYDSGDSTKCVENVREWLINIEVKIVNLLRTCNIA